jgi:hypothetical protein
MRFETGEAGFAEQAREVLAILAARPGYLSGRLVRAYDDPSLWCLVTEWDSVGSYRRALGSYEVKAGATPFLARALPEPSAFEPLASAEPGGQVRVSGSDRSVASRS